MNRKLRRKSEKQHEKRSSFFSSEDHNRRVAEFVEIGKISEAIKELHKMVNANPQFPDNYYNLGVLATSQRRFKEAMKYYKKAIKIKPEFFEAHYNLAGILKDFGQWEKAIFSYENAILINPNAAEVFYNLGSIFGHIEQREKAIANYQKAIALNANFSEAYNNLGNIFSELKKWEEAVKSYNQAISIDPDFSGAYNNLGNALVGKKKFEDAAVNYRKALKCSPNFVDSHVNLGNVLKEMGQLDEALKSYNAALAINPKSIKAMYNLSLSLQLKGKFKEAYKILGKGLDENPDNALISNSLIDLLNYYWVNDAPENKIKKAQNSLQKLNFKVSKKAVISDKFVFELYRKCNEILTAHKVFQNNYPSQAWRGAVFNQNCNRHMLIFDEFNVIPKHCFGCYKITIEPRTVVELIKLFLLFDILVLPNDNPRKCLVELRPEISGAFKGLIYCRSFNESETLLPTVTREIKSKISNTIAVSIKRGCSEFPIAYPSYSYNHSEKNKVIMGYNEEWRDVEKYVDENLIGKIYPFAFNDHNHSKLTVRDILTIRTWLAYAAAIGDSSYIAVSGTEVKKLDPREWGAVTNRDYSECN